MKRELLVALALAAAPTLLQAEYGDVVLNRHADRQGVRPVVFPHWFHRIRFRCKVCHSELGFKMRAGANEVLMSDIIDGKFCGMCHNGQVAWGPERCDLCHSGLPGKASGIIGGGTTSGPGRW
jgi:c(7)-type cytochrome triheme protein